MAIQKIIKTKEVKLSIDDIAEMGYNGGLENYIVYYYSQNTDCPVFLKCITNRYGFMSPIFGRRLVYEGKNPKESLEKASKARDLFIVHKDEWRLLFNSKSK